MRWDAFCVVREDDLGESLGPKAVGRFYKEPRRQSEWKKRMTIKHYTHLQNACTILDHFPQRHQTVKHFSHLDAANHAPMCTGNNRKRIRKFAVASLGRCLRTVLRSQPFATVRRRPRKRASDAWHAMHAAPPRRRLLGGISESLGGLQDLGGFVWSNGTRDCS